MVPLDGTAGVQRIVRPGRLQEGHLSPDGRAVAYSSDETGRAEVYFQALPSHWTTLFSRADSASRGSARP